MKVAIVVPHGHFLPLLLLLRASTEGGVKFDPWAPDYQPAAPRS